MANSIIETTKSVIKHWYLLLIVGLIFIITGVWVAFTPLSAYLALSLLFGFSFTIAGLIEITFSVANRKSMKGWGWTFIYGLFNLLIGIILFNNPLISMATLPLYVGYVVLFRSVMTIGAALDRENYGISGPGSLLIAGILGLIFSFVLLWDPGFGGLTLVLWTAVALVTAGFYSILFSFRLKKLS